MKSRNEKLYGVLSPDWTLRDRDGLLAWDHLATRLDGEEWGLMRDAQSIVYFEKRATRDEFQERFGGLAVTLDRIAEGATQDMRAIRGMLSDNSKGKSA